MGMALTKRDHVPGFAGTHGVGRFDFHGQQLPVLLQDKVNFLPGTEPPMVEVASGRAIAPDEQVARDQGLEMKAAGRGLA